MVQGKRKRDLLAFKEELSLALVGHTRVVNCGKGRKRRSTAEVEERRLAKVGSHLPQKGEGKEHRCVVCRKKRAFWITANPDRDVKECPYTLFKTTFCCIGCEPVNSVYLCIKKTIIALQTTTQKCSFGVERDTISFCFCILTNFVCLMRLYVKTLIFEFSIKFSIF